MLRAYAEWIDTEDAEGRVAVKTSHGRVLSEYIVFRDNYGITETVKRLVGLSSYIRLLKVA